MCLSNPLAPTTTFPRYLAIDCPPAES
jgi:hypothetical protein